MAYSTITSILTILPGMPQTATSQGYSNTTSVISKHLERASAYVDSMIAKRYSVPLSDSCPIVDNITEDITAYYVYRSFYTQDNHNKGEYLEELKNIAMSNLELIRNGDIDIVDTTGDIVDERSSSDISVIDSNTRTYQPFFDVDASTDWEFDDGLLDSVSDKR